MNSFYLYYLIISLLNHCMTSMLTYNVFVIHLVTCRKKIHLLDEIMFENQACSSNVLTHFYSNYILKCTYHSWLLPDINYKPRILGVKIEGFHFLVHKLLCVLPNMRLELRNKGSLLQLCSSETYPYPKGKHNGATGPKYASW